jgi:hypothetical protein
MGKNKDKQHADVLDALGLALASAAWPRFNSLIISERRTLPIDRASITRRPGSI